MCNLSLGLIEEGEKKGRREGRMEGRENIIAHMLKKGRSPEAIADDTGVTLQEVKAVQERMLVGHKV